jgi:hypothetical protein
MVLRQGLLLGVFNNVLNFFLVEVSEYIFCSAAIFFIMTVITSLIMSKFLIHSSQDSLYFNSLDLEYYIAMYNT